MINDAGKIITAEDLLALILPHKRGHVHYYKCDVEGCDECHEEWAALELKFKELSGGSTDFPDYPIYHEEAYICPGCEHYYKTQGEADACCRRSGPRWECREPSCFHEMHPTLGAALECIKDNII